MNQTIEKETSLTRQHVVWTDQTDEVLLAAYRDYGIRDAFAELVHRYERELYSYLRRYLGDAAMGEDAFQATFLQVHLKCAQFEEGRRVKPWLYAIATHQAIDAQRRNKRHRMASLNRRQITENQDDVGTLLELLESAESDPTAQMEADERREWIKDAIQALPQVLVSAVILIYYQGMKYREAAEVLGVPVGTVKSRLHTAILKLNEAWKNAHAS